MYCVLSLVTFIPSQNFINGPSCYQTKTDTRCAARWHCGWAAYFIDAAGICKWFLHQKHPICSAYCQSTRGKGARWYLWYHMKWYNRPVSCKLMRIFANSMSVHGLTKNCTRWIPAATWLQNLIFCLGDHIGNTQGWWALPKPMCDRAPDMIFVMLASHIHRLYVLEVQLVSN